VHRAEKVKTGRNKKTKLKKRALHYRRALGKVKEKVEP
jgi:hypothetical protein